MKLLFAIKTVKRSKGGAERVITEICSGLVKRNHEVTLLTFDPNTGNCLYPLHASVSTCWMGIGNSGEKAGIYESLKRIAALRREVSHKNPDVVIAFQHSMFVLMALALIGKRIPLIASEHIVPAHYSGKPAEFSLMCLAGWLSDRMTVLSENIKKTYPSFLKKRIVPLPNPVNIPTIVREHNVSSTGCILNVGRLDKQKDQATLIRAFDEIVKKYPGWKLHIIGQGKLKPQLDKLVNELGVKDDVLMQDCTDDISSAYLDADIFAISSLYESFGLVTAEAMAHGLPVVGFSDCPGTNELIVDGETGILVDGDDRVKAFAKGIETLILEPKRRRNFGLKGRERIKQFSPKKNLDDWELLINRVLQKK